MTPSLRKAMVTAHLITSVGWLGAIAAYGALDIAATTGQNSQTVRAAHLAMDLRIRYVIIPLALASLLTLFATAVLLLESQRVSTGAALEDGHTAGMAGLPWWAFTALGLVSRRDCTLWPVPVSWRQRPYWSARRYGMSAIYEDSAAERAPRTRQWACGTPVFSGLPGGTSQSERTAAMAAVMANTV